MSAFWATILAERGIENAEQAKQFFNPSWAQIPNPYGLKDMDKAVALLLQAMTDGQHILLFGDYDVDGTTATALMYDFIRLYCGYEKVHYYLPDRYGEGYGLSLDAVEHAQSLGAKLLVTLDCGITGIEPITAARALDIEVIVLDHHVPSDTLPPASAIVNPLQVDCSYPSKNLSGCGLAFKLAQAMAQRLEIAPQKVQELLDLVAVSTACDIVDVRGENRVLLHFGLQRLERQPRPGLLALIKASGKKAPFSVSDIVFGIGPAGTGKTYLAVAMALALLRNREVSRMILSRPAVDAGESLGFLPGDYMEKVDPYLRPLTDALAEMVTSDKLKSMMEKRIVEVTPLAYMRGRTFNNSVIILDEAQNATATQMKMFLTRMGRNSKLIITGDITQIDLPRRTDSGLVQIQEVLKGIQGIAFVYFDKGDVVRHRLVAEIIDAYERYGQKQEERREARFEAKKEQTANGGHQENAAVEGTSTLTDSTPMN